MAVFDCAVFDEAVFDTDCTDDDPRPVQTTAFRQPVYSHVYKPPDPSSQAYEGTGGVEYYSRAVVDYPNQRGVLYTPRFAPIQTIGASYVDSVRKASMVGGSLLVLTPAASISWGCAWTASVPVLTYSGSVMRGTTMQQVEADDARAFSILRALGIIDPLTEII